MAFNSITRLRLRSILTLTRFLSEAQATAEQARRAPGFIAGALLPEGRLVFWTRTAWESEDAMKAYRDSGAHRAAMPKLLDWCDEARTAHWHGEVATDWNAIFARMAAEGRNSRVRRPSRAHQEGRIAALLRWAPEQTLTRAS